jgi:hypothetical protein
MKTGRNEPCSCGSGKKSKQCCQSAGRQASKSGSIGLIIAGVAVIGAIAVIAATRGDSTEVTAAAPAAQASLPAGTPSGPQTAPLSPAAPLPGAQPPGAAPAGKVWSPEHGHWHDKPQTVNEWVTVTPQKSVPLNAPGAALPVNIPAPNGPAPAGAVWSPEHGHWHDAKTGLAIQHDVPPDVATQMKQPGIPDTMKNYVWSEEHKHWHRKDANGEHETAMVVQPPNGGPVGVIPSNTAPTSSNPK